MPEVAGIYDTKKIDELNPLVKLSGQEVMLIDDGNGTMNVTVDTLLGYIRDQINSGTGGSSVPSTVSSAIHVIHPGDPDVPVASRPKGHFYIKVTDENQAQIATGLPRLIKVSPNMRLRMIND